MKKILIKKILLLSSMLCLGGQIKDERITNEREIGKTPSKPVQVLMLKISIDEYISMTELLIADLENEFFFKDHPYKTMK